MNATIRGSIAGLTLMIAGLSQPGGAAQAPAVPPARPAPPAVAPAPQPAPPQQPAAPQPPATPQQPAVPQQPAASQPAAPGAPVPEKPMEGATANLAAQVLLDRLGYSTGEIDGRLGRNLGLALTSFQKSRKLAETGKPDPVTLGALIQDAQVGVLLAYRITAEDAAGPFVKIPAKLAQQASLPALGYRSLEEMLAERFHCSPDLLRRLNRGTKLAAGALIRAPNVLPPPTEKAAQPAARIVVAKASKILQAFDAEGKLLLLAPVSAGSVHDPLPIGSWKVKGVAKDPVFHYNPKLFWDSKEADVKATILAGPNNPVGSVWVDIDKDHYGMHGTPEPGNIGHTESHGCVRLTNWDALRLASLVVPGTPVEFVP